MEANTIAQRQVNPVEEVAQVLEVDTLEQAEAARQERAARVAEVAGPVMTAGEARRLDRKKLQFTAKTALEASLNGMGC